MPAFADAFRGRRVLVTGATGFIGRHLADALIAAGADVHVLVRGSSPTPVTTHRADLLDASAVRVALEAAQPEVVFHLAAYGARPGENDRRRMIDVNVVGSANLWDALPASTRHVVVAGTSREYAPAVGPVSEDYPCGASHGYPASKHAATTLLAACAKEDGRHLTIVRPFGPYGPGDESDRVLPHAIRKLLRNERVPLSDGRQSYDFTYIDDVVAAFLLAGSRQQGETVAVFNIGGGAPATLRSALEIAADVVGGDARPLLDFGSLPRRPNDSVAVCADISAARAALGYEPAVSLREGISRTVAWHRAAVNS